MDAIHDLGDINLPTTSRGHIRPQGRLLDGDLRFLPGAKRRHPHHHQAGSRLQGQGQHHLQDRHGLLPTAPSARHYERVGIRAVPPTTTLFRQRRQPPRREQGHTPLSRFGLFRFSRWAKGRTGSRRDRPARPSIPNYAICREPATNRRQYASFSYNDTEGIIQDSGQQRFTGRINLERQLFKWMKVGYTGSYTWRHNDQNKSSIGGTAWYSSAHVSGSRCSKPNGTDANPLYSTMDRRSTRGVR